jgi:hypothetical protein
MQQGYEKVYDEFIEDTTELGLQKTLKSHSDAIRSILKRGGLIMLLIGQEDQSSPVEEQSSRSENDLEVRSNPKIFLNLPRLDSN